jgi:putative protease
MLKITSPFREKEEVSVLIEAGADELYCGYLSPEWVKRYASLEFERKGPRSNFTDLKELRRAVDLAHKKNTPVYLTLNGLYVREQYPLLLKIVKQLEQIDFDGYIVADIGLLLTLRKNGFKRQMHISTGGTVFNSEAVNFYRSLGASRIILDRQTTLQSIEALSKDNPDIDFEVFILNTLCVYIDGFCTFMHIYGRDSMEDISKKDWKEDEKLHLITAYGPEAHIDACCLKYSVWAYSSTGRRLNTNNIHLTFYKHLADGVECGACAIYDISKTKVKSIKIVGRQLNPEIRLKNTRFIRSALNILENNKGISRQDFIHKTQELYRQTYEYKKRCRGNNCYHPEVLYR